MPKNIHSYPWFYIFAPMANQDDTFKKVISHAKEYGMYFKAVKFTMV
ncbi:hypothetical protein JCM19302_317 [Jejuia pallidilutea]|uniref:Uncharacterized protein n=1 Tax=Jejuia pallidilutea TaxID=504487 RepID=A0A090WXA5_9FLAO|nr:hypothetical protein JCM19302_317 [Jejuia pallidilutea]